MRRHTWLVAAVAIGLLLLTATGCAQKAAKPSAETSSTVDPATGYMTEPPKKAEDAASDLNDATDKTQDAIDDAGTE